MFSGGEKTSSPSYRNQAAANNLSKTRPYKGLLQARSPRRAVQPVRTGGSVLQAKGKEQAQGKDVVQAQVNGVVQLVGKKGHIAIGAALGTLIPLPIIGNIIGGYLGYKRWKDKQKNTSQSGVNLTGQTPGPGMSEPGIGEDKMEVPVEQSEKANNLLKWGEVVEKEDKERLSMEEEKVPEETEKEEVPEQPVDPGARVAKKRDGTLYNETTLALMKNWIIEVKDLILNGDYQEAYKQLTDVGANKVTFKMTIEITTGDDDPEKMAKRNLYVRKIPKIQLHTPPDDKWLKDEQAAKRVLPMFLEEYMHAYQAKSNRFLSSNTSDYKRTGKLEGREGIRKVNGQANYDEIDVMAKLEDRGFNVKDIGYDTRYKEREGYWEWYQQYKK